MFKIKVKNQGYIKEAEVEFVPGLNVLRGKSSQGKSTLFRAVETTIFNMPSDFLVTYGEKTSSVTIEYNDHKIVRDRNLNAKEYKTVYYIDDQKYVKTGKNALEEVQEKIGLKELSISGSKTHIAFSSAFGLPFLVDESPQKIFDFITYSSSNLDISDVVQKIKSDIAENKEETKKLEIEINTLKDMFLKQQKKQIIFSENKDIDKISDSLKKLNSSFNELSSIVEKSTKILKEGERLKSIPKIDNVDLDYNSLLLLNKTLSNLDAIKKEIKENEEKYKINESILEKFPSFFNVSDFFNKNNELKNLKKTLEFLKSVTDIGRKMKKITTFSFDPIDVEKQTKLKELNSFINNLKKEGTNELEKENTILEEKLQEVNAEIKKFAFCPICGAKL
jgi:DNA repair protein RecN (Recombination protein N)